MGGSCPCSLSWAWLWGGGAQPRPALQRVRRQLPAASLALPGGRVEPPLSASSASCCCAGCQAGRAPERENLMKTLGGLGCGGLLRGDSCRGESKGHEVGERGKEGETLQEENKLSSPPPPGWLDGALLGSGEPRTPRARPSERREQEREPTEDGQLRVRESSFIRLPFAMARRRGFGHNRTGEGQGERSSRG